jgi:hypothetical protein
MFGCHIIRTFQLVFSERTVFFSHNKSANITFSYDFSAKRTGSKSMNRMDFTFCDHRRGQKRREGYGGREKDLGGAAVNIMLDA